MHAAFVHSYTPRSPASLPLGVSAFTSSTASSGGCCRLVSHPHTEFSRPSLVPTPCTRRANARTHTQLHTVALQLTARTLSLTYRVTYTFETLSTLASVRSTQGARSAVIPLVVVSVAFRHSSTHACKQVHLQSHRMCRMHDVALSYHTLTLSRSAPSLPSGRRWPSADALRRCSSDVRACTLQKGR
jgi:hypothetical protein